MFESQQKRLSKETHQTGGRQPEQETTSSPAKPVTCAGKETREQVDVWTGRYCKSLSMSKIILYIFYSQDKKKSKSETGVTCPHTSSTADLMQTQRDRYLHTYMSAIWH